MCMIDDAEHVELLRQKTQTAKIPHKCRECFRVIDAGEQYHVDAFVFDGEFTNHKTCLHCMTVRNWLQDECGGFLYGGVEEDVREHVFDHDGYGYELYRAVVGMGWKWRTRSGRLLPIPTNIRTTDELRGEK
jgi:hypothetical protein